MDVSPPRTRAERQAETVRALTAAAAELFLRDGYVATPVHAVAAQAGVTTGALYANFAGKAQLGLAALDRIRERQLHELAEHLAGGGDLAARAARLGGWAERTVGASGWPRVELEFALAAREDPVLVAALAERRAALHAALGAVLEGQLRELGVTPALSIEEMVRALLGLGIGISVQRMLDPTVPVDALPRVFGRLVSPAS